MATTLKISANRLNMADPLPAPSSYGLKSGIFKPREPVSLSAAPSMMLFGIISRARN